MFNNNVQLGTLDINFNNIKGTENSENFSVNGSISIGLSINQQILNKFEPLLEKAVGFAQNKFIGKSRIQKELDELELLEIRVRKARLQKQLRDLEK